MPFIDASGMKINFPYDPYPCQVDYMEKVVQSLQTVRINWYLFYDL